MVCHQCQRPDSFLKCLGIKYILDLRSLCSHSAIHMHTRERAAERPHLASMLLNAPSASILIARSGSQQDKHVLQRAD